MEDKAKLMEMLKQDMKHWSADVLREALRFIDDKCLTENENGAWWWKLRRSVYAELVSREANDELPAAVNTIV